MHSSIDTVRVTRRDIVQECIEEVRRERMMRRLRLLERYLGEMDIPLKAGGILAFILFWTIGILAPFVVGAAYFVFYLPVCAIARANAERALGLRAHKMAASVLSLVVLGAGLALAFAPMPPEARPFALVGVAVCWAVTGVLAAVRGEWSR